VAGVALPQATPVSEWPLPAGLHLVTVEKSGYVPYQRPVQIAAGRPWQGTARLQPVAPPPRDWPTWRGRPDRNAVVTGSGLRPPLRLKWQQDLAWWSTTSPLVFRGRVYVGVQTINEGVPVPDPDKHRLFCLDADQGTILWSVPVYQDLGGSPTMGAGRIYLGDYTGWLHTWEAATGKPGWRFQFGNDAASMACVVGNDLYFGTDRGVYAVDAETGRERWHYPVDQGVYGLTIGEGKLFSSSPYDDSLRALAADSGQLVWSFEPGTMRVGACSFSDGVIYLASGERAYALDAETGEEIWRYDAEEQAFTNAPTVVDGKVYLGGIRLGGGELIALNQQDGTPVWKFGPVERITDSGLVINGVVYFESRNSYLYAVDAETGAELWHYRTGITPRGALAYADETLFACNDGTVYAFGN